MSAQGADESILIQPPGHPGMSSYITTDTHMTDTIVAASESAALGLLPEENNHYNVGKWFDLGGNTTHRRGQRMTNSDTDPDLDLPSSPPLTFDPPTRRVRNEYEFQVEKNKRLDEVEPGLTQFRGQRRLHIRQLEDIDKKRIMVMERIDKLNADVEKLRQQWGDLERDKAGLLGTQHSYEQKKAAQEQVVHKDDVIAKKYHDYLTLDEEVLVLDDSDDEDEDDLMYDWEAQQHVSGGGEQDHNQE